MVTEDVIKAVRRQAASLSGEKTWTFVHVAEAEGRFYQEKVEPSGQKKKSSNQLGFFAAVQRDLIQ